MFFLYQKYDIHHFLPVDLIYVLIYLLGIRQSSNYLLYFPVLGLFLSQYPLLSRQAYLVVAFTILINLHFRYILYFLFCNGFHQCSLLGPQQVMIGLHHTLVFLVLVAIVYMPLLLLLFLRECCNSYVYI